MNLVINEPESALAAIQNEGYWSFTCAEKAGKDKDTTPDTAFTFEGLVW